jgi:hypothetical protein
MAGKSFKRLQIDVTNKTVERLAELKEETNSTSIAEVCRKAFQSFSELKDYEDKGYQIILRKKDENDIIFKI